MASLANPRTRAAVTYLAALAVGLILVLRVFPHWALVGGLPPGAPPRADFGKDVIGQLYFFSQAWRLDGLSRLLLARRLEAPWGASIALTDSIPLLALAAKLLRPVLPPFEQVVTLYQAAAWVLQPAAAVFALRGAGERRFLPAMAVAVIAVSMPTLLLRLWHAALTGHWMLLMMLGLHLRIVEGSRAALLCACLLQVALLLVHPYLMLMASLVLLAAPVSLVLRRLPFWRMAALACVASSLVMLLLGQRLGYWGAASDGGFGYYSMNLVAPFWPTFSGLIPGIGFAPADATGGQADGYQYLGLGVLGLLAVSALAWRGWLAALRRQPGLLIACLALCALSLTNWVFFLHHELAHIPLRSTLFSQMRASGRLFWPVAYAALIGGSVTVLRRFPVAGVPVLLACAAIQFEDARTLRDIDRIDLAAPTPYPFDQARLAAILGAHRRLTVLPTFPCNGGGTALNEDLLWLAARHRMAINSIYLARQAHPQDCIPDEVMATRVAPGEIRVILPGYEQALAALPNADADCRRLTPYLLCTRRSELLAGLPAAVIRPLPMDRTLPVGAGEPGTGALIAGWALPASTGGIWSMSPTVQLGGRLAARPEDGGIQLRLRLAAMPVPTRWGGALPGRPVTVWVGARQIAHWVVGPVAADYQAIIPTDRLLDPSATIIALRSGPPTSLLDLGRSTDPRRFGLWLSQLSFSRQP